ncbi:glycosyltransferase [bacterium]|nr:glycosyltransferase [bacterium]
MNETLRSAADLGKTWALYPPGVNPPSIDNIEIIRIDTDIPHTLNAVLNNTESEYLAVVPEGAVVFDNLPDKLKRIEKDFGFIYGDWIENEAGREITKEAYSGPEDITERADLGPVVIYRTADLKRIGGWDEKLKYAFDYDARLKIGEISRLYRIPEPICRFHPPQIDKSSADKLFFPGKGKFGGFSYLFLEPEEEEEIEGVFLNALKRRKAYLKGEAPPMSYEKSDSPLVSVITPVFNREKYIGLAIESVIGGELRDFEYIIIDNGSTDNTIDVVEKYAAVDKRIRLIRNNINRIAYSLNLGLKAARGKYISQLDSDDLYTPRTLKAMTEYMEDTNCALAISYYSLIDQDGNDLPEFGIIKHLEYSRNNILRVDGAGAVRMWRRSAMMQFGGFDEKDLCDYGEDYDLVLKMGEKYSIGRVHEVLYKYRRHPDNSDIKRDPLFKLRNKNLARERALARRKEMNIE